MDSFYRSAAGVILGILVMMAVDWATERRK
jgi:hypothetical protein